MTDRERFLRSLRGGQIDRFVRYEHGAWATTQQRWIREGYPKNANFGSYFEMDPLFRISINSGYTDSPYQPKFQEKTIEETAGHRTYVDADGITKKELKRQRDTSMPQFIKFPVSNRDDWQHIVKRLNPADAKARIDCGAELEALRDVSPDVPTMLPICGAFGHPRNLLGDEGLAFVMYDESSLLEEILENWRDLYVELIRELTSRFRVDVLLIWEDMCYKSGPLISPEHVKQFMMPRYEEVIACARSCGVEAIIVDTDGDCLKLISLFLDADVDCLMPFEVQAGMDVTIIGRQFPGLSIMGGLDKRALAVDRTAIKKEVDRVMPAFLERGRFIPTLDHTVPPDVSLHSFLYYLDCVRSYEV